MSETSHSGLSQTQIAHFIEHGYVGLEGAFDGRLASQGRDQLWSAMGLSPDAPETWKQPVVRLGFMTGKPFVDAANTPLLHASYDALVGQGRWLRPNGLGTFPVRFPSPNDPGDAGWHVDASFGTDNPDFMQWRVNVKSSGRALLMLFLFSDVGELDAPTKIRKGSHRAIARQYFRLGKAVSRLAHWPLMASLRLPTAKKCWPPGKLERSISATLSSSTPHNRIEEPGLGSWPNLRSCRKVSLTRRYHRLRCK